MHFNSTEDVIADELFQAWYFKTDENKVKEWEHWLLLHQEYILLVRESIAWLNDNYVEEKDLPASQVEAAHLKLVQALESAPVIEIKPKSRRWWIPAAAAILLVIAGFAYWNRKEKTRLDSNYGHISEYKLPDGSQVMLNANSEITLDKEWNKSNDREVWLKGEAFFKVQKMPLKNKFIVHTNTMDIIVTGTQFNAISRDDESSVLLTEGSVTIKTPNGEEIQMKPGDFVKIEANQPSKKPVDQEKILAWKQAKLVFENTGMDDVAKAITRHYGVKVTLSGKNIADKKISGVMPNDNLDVLIEALETTGDFRITKLENELLISGQ